MGALDWFLICYRASYPFAIVLTHQTVAPHTMFLFIETFRLTHHTRTPQAGSKESRAKAAAKAALDKKAAPETKAEMRCAHTAEITCACDAPPLRPGPSDEVAGVIRAGTGSGSVAEC